MKLIRNQTHDGRCKYALILMAQLNPAEQDEVIESAQVAKREEDDVMATHVPSMAILIGNESPESQFFVMKYKDKFTASGLRGYLWAVEKELEKMPSSPERTALEEYAVEIAGELEKAEKVGCKIPD